MQKTFLLIRFDKFPREEVTKTLIKFSIENDKPQFIATPSTMITIFKSNFQHKEIYMELAKITPPVAFFLVDVTDQDFAINLPEDITYPLMEYLGKKKINKAEYDSLENKTEKELNQMLQEAIESENYELCSKIQSIINTKTN